jgi:hypothetical protein
MGIAGSNSLSKLALICVLFIAQWHLQTVRVTGDNWKNIIDSDGAGYYGYLPAIFIFKSFDYQLKQSADAKTLNKKEHLGGAIKYYYGEALLLLPFFTIADMITQSIDLTERTGYTFYYQLFCALAGIFYLFLGLVMLRSLLLRMHFSDGITAFALLLIFLATQLYYYSLHAPVMSHVYSFAMVATLLNLYHLQLIRYNVRRWLLISIVATLIVIIRPVNAIFILAFLPLSGSWEKSKEFTKLFLHSGKVIVFFSCLIGALLIFGQSFMYYIQTGKWWVYSYGDEGFNWFEPHVMDMLFSYRKGLFVYAPILLFSIPGIWVLSKRQSPYWSITWLFLMFSFLYVSSSWWYWAYGGSFGMRPFIDAYPLFILPIAAFFEFVCRYLVSKIVVIAGAILLAVFQLFQTYQYITNVLPYEFITKEKYWHLFLKHSHQFQYVYPPDNEFRLPKQPGTVYFETALIGQDSIIELSSIGEAKADRFEIIAREWAAVIPLDTLKDTLYAEVSAEINMEECDSDASLVTAFQEDWKAYFWERNYLVHQITQKNNWSAVRFILPLPNYRPPLSFFTISLHNNNTSKIQARKLRVRIFSE